VATSLGALGIVSTLTLRCVPAFALQARRVVRPIAEVLEEFDRIQRENQYVDMLYFPITGDVELLLVNRVAQGEERRLPPMPRPAARQPSGAVARKARRASIAFAAGLVRLLHAPRLPGIQRWFTRRTAGTVYAVRSGRSDYVLAYGDDPYAIRTPGAIQDMEFAVPYAQAATAIAALRDHFGASGHYPLLPVHIRCSPASELWMSPAHNRSVCWLELWIFPPSEPFARELHEVLRPFEYRFHWGKTTRADRQYICGLYERWDDFAALRRMWDPDGAFLNSYLESFFGSRVDGAAASGSRGPTYSAADG
jgi:L-gulono-1,4-lactone dehydrogenase